MSELLKKGKPVYREEYIKEMKDICNEWNCSFCPFTDDDFKMHCSKVLLKLEERRPKEMVNHPSHYNHYPMETIDMMVAIFGKEAARQWYLDKAKELE